METIEAKIKQNPELEKYRDILVYDWPNWDEHVEWVKNATVSEITDWAESIK